MIQALTILLTTLLLTLGAAGDALTAGVNRVGFQACENEGGMNQGGLFARDYLTYGIRDSKAWTDLKVEDVAALEADFMAIFTAFPTDKTPNESRTESDLIWKVVQRLGWQHYTTQDNLAANGRAHVPDGLLFENAEAKARADKLALPVAKFEVGSCILEAKKWQRPLDRAGKSRDESETPSSQMLRYLRRADDLTEGKLRWGILSNGRHWRLYFQGAKSVSEGYCELDLPAILGIEGFSDLATPFSAEDRQHWLKVFALVFRRESFFRAEGESQTFHQTALEKGKYYEEGVAKDLSTVVFDRVFPGLVRALAAHDNGKPTITPNYLSEVKESALILLYRLLFVLYAEDRNLLPVESSKYDDYGLRKPVRNNIAQRIDTADTFSETRATYWDLSRGLFESIAKGDRAIGLPPYNGGLFDLASTPLLERARLPDSIYAPLIDDLCRVERDGERRYINYRDLGVRQLGSIYERLLEHEVFEEGGVLGVRLNPFARKGSGSYYTPDELVRLIIERTVGPLVQERVEAFTALAKKPPKGTKLEEKDPATEILNLKICDPAMGSGHFLVDLVDYLADEVIISTETAAEAAEDYRSPLLARIAAIRAQIRGHADENGWAVSDDQLDDKQIVRRMVLKRVIYGVDKNPMAVELAKVALWLHTFTVGAPLSFLDHHLRCGDSLFGETVHGVMDKLAKRGGLILHNEIQKARASTTGMEAIELNTDADIAGAKHSAAIFEDVTKATAPLASFMSLLHAFEWMDPEDKADRAAIDEWLDGNFGEPFEIAAGRMTPQVAKPQQQSLLGETAPVQASLMKGATGKSEVAQRFAGLLADARALVAAERYHHWEIAFPGVWNDWQSNEPSGGFDAIVGNPPWDRIKFQEVEWFAARRPEIAHADTAARRKTLVEKLKKSGDPLASQYDLAAGRAAAMLRMARESEAYPLLSGGDVNIYSLFVERALGLVKPTGLVGLLTPSGIASDKTAAQFFRSISTTNRLAALFDFENKKVFFPDIHASFKFCAIVMGGKKRSIERATCAFYLHGLQEIADPERSFAISGKDFALVNPNTGTAPIFRTRRDAELTTAIYSRVPVLVDRSSGTARSVWPVKYVRMFDMTNDSGLFHSRAQLEKLGAYTVGGNRWKKGATEYVPLYEGKMVQAYDHRAASVEVDTTRLHRPGQPLDATPEQHDDPKWLPESQFWVSGEHVSFHASMSAVLGFKEITAPTNQRTMIASLFPRVAFGNKVPIFVPDEFVKDYSAFAPLVCANFNSVPLDFATRQKVHGQTLNLFLVEQLPVIPQQSYTRKFGHSTAAEIIKAEVLALTYTAHDMEPFARDMGYDGPPFRWDEMDRLKRKAKLDAIYFLLYGITDRDDVKYIYSTFPIVQREEERAYDRYLSRDYCLMYMNALEAGDPDAAISI